MSYRLTKPCPKCPFRNDIPGYLTKARIRELERSLERSEFSCHLTTSEDGWGEDHETYVSSGKEDHCAGALILLEKLERPSQMMRIMERIGGYDRTKLNMQSPVVDTWAELRRRQKR